MKCEHLERFFSKGKIEIHQNASSGQSVTTLQSLRRRPWFKTLTHATVLTASLFSIKGCSNVQNDGGLEMNIDNQNPSSKMEEVIDDIKNNYREQVEDHMNCKLVVFNNNVFDGDVGFGLVDDMDTPDTQGYILSQAFRRAVQEQTGLIPSQNEIGQYINYFEMKEGGAFASFGHVDTSNTRGAFQVEKGKKFDKENICLLTSHYDFDATTGAEVLKDFLRYNQTSDPNINPDNVRLDISKEVAHQFILLHELGHLLTMSTSDDSLYRSEMDETMGDVYSFLRMAIEGVPVDDLKQIADVRAVDSYLHYSPVVALKYNNAMAMDGIIDFIEDAQDQNVEKLTEKMEQWGMETSKRTGVIEKVTQSGLSGLNAEDITDLSWVVAQKYMSFSSPDEYLNTKSGGLFAAYKDDGMAGAEEFAQKHFGGGLDTIPERKAMLENYIERGESALKRLFPGYGVPLTPPVMTAEQQQNNKPAQKNAPEIKL